MNKPFPKSISPTPIVSSVIEIRFETVCPNDAVFGILYNELKGKYPKYNTLPITQIPEHIRHQDTNMLNAPHNKLFNDNEEYSILIGPRVLSFIYNKKDAKNYPGWTEHIKIELDYILEKLFKSGIVKKVSRLGIRYTDFFELNIFDYTEFNVMEKDNRIDNDQTQLMRTTTVDRFVNNITVTNNSKYKNNITEKSGSIIDIDTILGDIPSDFTEKFSEYCESAHTVNKELFFSMLTKKFIDSMSPIYKEN
ncbi:MAG: TIGR04255 family protein [Campylobacterota bacterium]|nr:TIGR04255 family protein [Campylobacterota bacterium]